MKIIHIMNKIFNDKPKMNNLESRVDFSGVEMPFVAKGTLNSVEDAEKFGGTLEKFNFWRPHMCAVCCIKMVGDAVHKTDGITLSDLVDMSVNDGVYRREGDDVKGAFHYPMVDLLKKLGIYAEVGKNIDIQTLKRLLIEGKVIFLSVNLAKVRGSKHKESHMIVLYKYDESTGTFHLNDCANFIDPKGYDIQIDEQYLKELSNNKGVIVG